MATPKRKVAAKPEKVSNGKDATKTEKALNDKERDTQVDTERSRKSWDMILSPVVDGTAIEEYMALDFWQALETERQTLSGNDSASTLDERIAAKVSIPGKIQKEQALHREKLIKRVNFSTAKALYERVGCGAWDTRSDADVATGLGDPVRGPVIRILLIWEEKRHQALARLEKEMDALHAKVDRKSNKVTRPPLPTPLITALRFAVNDPELEDEIIKMVFRDFCRAGPAMWPGEPEFLVRMGGLIPFDDESPDPSGVSPNFWRPFFYDPIYVRGTTTLTWLGLRMLPFFQRCHGRTDSSGMPTNMKSVGGKHGAVNREVKKWVNYTKDLIPVYKKKCLKGLDRDTILKEFAATRVTIKKDGNEQILGERAQKGICYFFGTLLNHGWKGRDSELIKRIHSPNSEIVSKKDQGFESSLDDGKHGKRRSEKHEPIQIEDVQKQELRYPNYLVQPMNKVPREVILQCHKMLWDEGLIKEIK